MNRSVHTASQSRSPTPDSQRFVIAGGTIHDPLHGRDGVVDDIWVENGRIVARPDDPKAFTRIDASGRVVMPGGVDLHSHVAGPKVNAGRRIAPQLARRTPAAVPTIHSTGALYAALGYTTVFDAAIATAAADVAHMELADLPILDKGIYLLAADDADILAALDRAQNAEGDRELQRLIAAAMQAGKGWAVKVANPGGPAVWKHGRRGDPGYHSPVLLNVREVTNHINIGRIRECKVAIDVDAPGSVQRSSRLPREDLAKGRRLNTRRPDHTGASNHLILPITLNHDYPISDLFDLRSLSNRHP
jgi:hypothetical protein